MNELKTYELLRKSFKWFMVLSEEGYFEDCSDEKKILEFKDVFMSENFKNLFMKDEELKDDLFKAWLRESFLNTEEYESIDFDNLSSSEYHKIFEKRKKKYEQKFTKEKFYK